MTDKRWLIWGHLCVTDISFKIILFDGKSFALDEEAWKKHAAAAAKAGANAVRILPYAVWDDRSYGRKGQFCPWVLDPLTNKWDLGKLNSHYYPIMRRIFEIANSYNLEVWAPWFDNCQLHRGYWDPMVPWKHNLNGVSSFYDEAADKYVIGLIKKNQAEFSGLRMFWPWGNELNKPEALDWAQRVIFPLLPDLGIPFNKMTYGATMTGAPYNGDGTFGQHFSVQDKIRAKFELVFGKQAKTAVIREVHGCGSKTVDKFSPFGLAVLQASWWWGNKPVGKWIASDDGVHDQPGPGGRPDKDRWYRMARWHFENFDNVAGVEHCPESWDWPAEVEIMEAISRAYHDVFGIWPENYGKHPYVPPQPPPPPEPPQPPEPPEPPEKSCRYFWENHNYLHWLRCVLFGKH